MVVDDRRDLVRLEAMLDALAQDGVLIARSLLGLQKECILVEADLLVASGNDRLVLVVLVGEQRRDGVVLSLHF